MSDQPIDAADAEALDEQGDVAAQSDASAPVVGESEAGAEVAAAGESASVEGEAVVDDAPASDDAAEEGVSAGDDDADDGLDADLPDLPPVELIEEGEGADDDIVHQWYILKVQVNREGSIQAALERRVKIEGLEAYFNEIVVPTEDVVEFTKSGKKKVVKKKLYPGYILVHMHINDDTWFVVRETPGIGDFTGSAGKPTPLEASEVERILRSSRPPEDPEEPAAAARIGIPFNVGDRVRVKEGHFENFEGDIEAVDDTNGRVTVMINIFGRSTPVELNHWEMEAV